MSFSIRKMLIPHDYKQVAELLNIVLSEETSAEELAEEDSKIPATGHLSKDEHGFLTGYDRYRIVAVDEVGQVLGYGISWRAPWTAAGELNHVLIVHPDERGRGTMETNSSEFLRCSISNLRTVCTTNIQV